MAIRKAEMNLLDIGQYPQGNFYVFTKHYLYFYRQNIFHFLNYLYNFQIFKMAKSMKDKDNLEGDTQWGNNNFCPFQCLHNFSLHLLPMNGVGALTESQISYRK